MKAGALMTQATGLSWAAPCSQARLGVFCGVIGVPVSWFRFARLPLTPARMLT